MTSKKKKQKTEELPTTFAYRSLIIRWTSMNNDAYWCDCDLAAIHGQTAENAFKCSWHTKVYSTAVNTICSLAAGAEKESEWCKRKIRVVYWVLLLFMVVDSSHVLMKELWRQLLPLVAASAWLIRSAYAQWAQLSSFTFYLHLSSMT